MLLLGEEQQQPPDVRPSTQRRQRAALKPGLDEYIAGLARVGLLHPGSTTGPSAGHMEDAVGRAATQEEEEAEEEVGTPMLPP